MFSTADLQRTDHSSINLYSLPLRNPDIRPLDLEEQLDRLTEPCGAFACYSGHFIFVVRECWTGCYALSQRAGFALRGEETESFSAAECFDDSGFGDDRPEELELGVLDVEFRPEMEKKSVRLANVPNEDDGDLRGSDRALPLEDLLRRALHKIAIHIH